MPRPGGVVNAGLWPKPGPALCICLRPAGWIQLTVHFMNRLRLYPALILLLLGFVRPLAAADAPAAAAAPKPGYKVVVKISFNEQGVGEEATVVESDDPTSDTILHRIALTLAAQVKPEPHLKDGKPVKFSAVVPFDFPVEGDEGAAANNAPKPTFKNPGQRPVYPENLAAAGVVGGAILEMIIGADGNIRQVNVLQASHPEFARSAEAAVRTWVLVPAMKDGVPVESRWRTAFAYSVEGKDVDWKWRVAPRPSIGGNVVFSHLRLLPPAAAGPAAPTLQIPPAPAGPPPEKK